MVQNTGLDDRLKGFLTPKDPGTPGAPVAPVAGDPTKRQQGLPSQTGPVTGTHRQDKPLITALDTALFIPRGVEGAAKDFYGLLDTLTLDVLPDWDQASVFGHPESTAGEVATGLIQFATGFAVTGGVLGAVAGAAKVGEAASLLGRAAAGEGFLGSLVKGAVTDFAFFDGASGRLSDSLKGTFLENDLTAYLETGAEDSDLEGRLKNAIEGLGLGAISDTIFTGLKKLSKFNHARIVAKAEKRVLTDAEARKVIDSVTHEGDQTIEAGLDPLTSAEELAQSKDSVKANAGRAYHDIEDLPTAMAAGEIPETIAEPLVRAGITDLKAFFEEIDARFADAADFAGKNVKDTNKELPKGRKIPKGATNLLHLGSTEEQAAVLRALETVELLRSSGKRFGKTKIDISEQLYDARKQASEFLDDAVVASESEKETLLIRVASDRARRTGDKLLDGLRDTVDLADAVSARKLFIAQMAPTLLDEFHGALKKIGSLVQASDAQLVDIAERYDRMSEYFAQLNVLKSSSGRDLRATQIDAAKGTLPIPSAKAATAASAEDAAKLGDAMRKLGGSSDAVKARENVIKLLEQTNAMLESASSLKDRIRVFDALGRAKVKGQGLGMTMEYWMGNLLNGYRTQMVNIAGNATVAAMRPVESFIGGAAQGAGALLGFNSFQVAGKQMQRALDEASSMVRTFLDIANIRAHSEVRDAVKRTFKTGESTLVGAGGAEIQRIGADGAQITGKKVQDTIFGYAARSLLGPQGDALAGAAGAAVGAYARFGPRLLSAADEFFKQLNFRATMNAELLSKGRSRGLSGNALHEFTAIESKRILVNGQAVSRKTIWDKAVADTRLELGAGADLVDVQEAATKRFYDAQRSAEASLEISKTAAEDAGLFTFSNKLDSGGIIDNAANGLSNLAMQHPQMRFFFPFITTPANLMKFGAKRTLLDPTWAAMKFAANAIRGGGMEGLANSTSESLRMLAVGTAKQKADVLARWSIATGSTVGLASLAANYMENLNAAPGEEPHSVSLVGRGPADPAENRAWRAAGNTPYSIQVGDKAFSFARIDPYASILGIIADTMQYSYFSESDDTTTSFATAIVAATSKNFLDKSYLSGLDNLILLMQSKDMVKIQQTLNSYAGSFAPGGALVAQVNQAAFDGEYKEIRTAMDAVAARYPYYSGKVEPRRNILGEPMKRIGWDEQDSLLARWSPFPITDTEKADPVMVELGALRHPWRAESARISLGGQSVDLLTYEGKDGQTAVDRLRQLSGEVKVGGKTLRDRLSDLIENPDYKALPYPAVDDVGQGPRERTVSGILAAYRATAKSKLLEEFPAIMEDVKARLNFQNEPSTDAARSIFTQ